MSTLLRLTEPITFKCQSTKSSFYKGESVIVVPPALEYEAHLRELCGDEFVDNALRLGVLVPHPLPLIRKHKR